MEKRELIYNHGHAVLTFDVAPIGTAWKKPIDFNPLRNFKTLAEVLRLCPDWEVTSLDSVPHRGRCPLCATRTNLTRTFKIDPDMGRWFCHYCRIGGDAVELLSRMFGIGRYEAAAKIYELKGETPVYLPMGQCPKRSTGVPALGSETVTAPAEPVNQNLATDSAS